MHFNKHSAYEDKHALLSPSKYHWLRYTDEKLEAFYKSRAASILGTKAHDFARGCIENCIPLANNQKTLNLFVNESIAFGMTPEVTLFYSDLCFGKTDAIAFRDDILRISDLKTGVSHASFDQLVIYAALFFLEYGISPFDIHKTELRLYQNNEVKLYEPAPEEIAEVMTRIVDSDERLNIIRREEGLNDVYEP